MEKNAPEPRPSFLDLADELAKAPAKLKGHVLDVMIENYPDAPAALLDGSATSDIEARNEAFYVSHDD